LKVLLLPIYDAKVQLTDSTFSKASLKATTMMKEEHQIKMFETIKNSASEVPEGNSIEITAPMCNGEFSQWQAHVLIWAAPTR